MGLLLTLPALAGLCIGLHRYGKIPAGAAPLAALSGVYLVLFLGGVAGLLPLAAWAAAALGWLLLLVALAETLRRKNAALWKGMAAPASLLFWVGALVLLARLAFLQPAFLNFDEYSFWGAATQLTHANGLLYPACETGRPWVMTELPGIPLMGYFFQLAGPFAPWRAIFGVDLLLLASLAAAVSCCKAKSPRLWGPVAAAALLLPTAMTIPGRTGLVNTTWLEILGDLPAGVLFGGAVAYWLAVRDENRFSRWMALPVLFLAAGIKSNTLPLALTAAGLILSDGLVCPVKGLAHGRARHAGFGLLALAVPAGDYLAWGRYTLPFVLANAGTGGMGDTANATLPEVVVNGVKMLLGGTGTEFFESRRTDLLDYTKVMALAFRQVNVSIFGTGLSVVCVILLVFALALWAAPGWQQKLRVGVTAAGSAACFGGYWLMLLLSYAFLFKDAEPSLLGLTSYPRYMDSFYSGWLLLALAVLACQAGRKVRLAGAASCLAAAAVLTVCTLTAWQPQFTILGASRHVYDADHARTAQAGQIRAALDPADKVFLIRQGDDGFYWFWYAQALMPNIVTYGAGGGTYGDPALDDGATPYYQSYAPAELDALIRESGADKVLIAQNDPIFTESYAALFGDGLAAAQTGPALYEIEPEGYRPVWALGEGAAE